MANLSSKKQLILDRLSASETIANGGIPKLREGYDTYKQIKESPIDFLLTLFRRTVGVDKMLSVFNDIIYNKLDEIEIVIKNNIYLSIDNLITCSLQQKLYDDLYTNGIDIDIQLIDLLDILKIDPFSEEGKLIYNSNDVNDLNQLLYLAIKNGNTQNWNNIIEITYIPIDKYEPKDENDSPKNVFRIKISPQYVDENGDKTLKSLTKDMIDNMTLFNKKDVITRVFDNVFNTTSKTLKKTLAQSIFEEKINSLVDKIIHNEVEEDSETLIIDDSFFSFSNKQYDLMLAKTKEKKQYGYKTDLNLEVEPYLSINDINNILSNINDETTIVQQEKIIETGIITAINNSTLDNGINNDYFKTKNSIIEKMIRELTLIIANSIITPKVMLIFLYNFKILELIGVNVTKDDIVSIVLKLLEPIITNIKNEILGFISDYIIKYVKNIALNVAKQWAIEISKSVKETIISLKPW